MSVTVKTEGFRDLEQALDQVSKSAGKGAMRRALRNAGEPLAEKARALAPRDDGNLARSITVSPKLAPGQTRDARKFREEDRTSVLMHVGPSYDLGRGGRHGHLVEFGTGERFKAKNGASTGKMPAQPFMRPAWAQDQKQMLQRISQETWKEIEKTIARSRARAARLAARGGR